MYRQAPALNNLEQSGTLQYKARQKMEQPIELKTSNLQITSLWLLGLFLVPVSVMTIKDAIQRGFKAGPLILGLVMLILFVVAVYLNLRGRWKSVRSFSQTGLIRRDGQQFSWNDLSRVVVQIKKVGRRRVHWRTEIHFKPGECAWLLPRSISNRDEVRAYVDSLPCEHTEVIVG